MIEFKNVSKTFSLGKREVHAVKDVSISIGKGEVFGIIGFSGAGKSTLLRLVNMLERPTSGSVLIQDVDVSNNIFERFKDATPQHRDDFPRLQLV